jgi:perosamine synthetase
MKEANSLMGKCENMDQSLLSLVEYIKSLYPDTSKVQLHTPVFLGKEKEYLIDCIDSTFVSYVGKYVTQFEEMTASYTGAKHAIATVNGTTALQVALQVAGVKCGDEVITQALTFVATANAISHARAYPVFVDVDKDTRGMSPEKLNNWLDKNVEMDSKTGRAINKVTKRNVSAIVPMHTFGHACRIDEIKIVADKYNIPLIEDSAESLGSFYKGEHTGMFGLAGIFSYNGNKPVTTGGGGMIITDDDSFAKKAKHITTTAKLPHPWDFVHDEIGYNYRLTNVNASIGVAQMERINETLANKRETANLYSEFCRKNDILFLKEPDGARSNYWLNAIVLESRHERDAFLEYSNAHGVMSRPTWRLMSELEMYKECQRDDLSNSYALEEKIVNIPSGVRVGDKK